jgi:hypothetical protein
MRISEEVFMVTIKPNQRKAPTPGSNAYKVFQFLKGGTTTGIEIFLETGVLSYNTSIFILRKKYDKIIETVLIFKDGKRYGLFTLVEGKNLNPME